LLNLINMFVENIDCRVGLRKLEDMSVDSIITDPPYELKLLGNKWDSSGIAFSPEVWCQAFRVLKPGGHVLAFGATKTYHRLACALEDAGFEIRDCIMWVYNTGMPHGKNLEGDFKGWSTCLKPSYEPIIVARKPISTSVQENMAQYQVGALNIDDCRTENKWPANILSDSENILPYFYCPKASAKDRDEGLEAFPLQRTGSLSATVDGSMKTGSGNDRKTTRRNIHPTVKPTELMRHLTKLVTYPAGLVTDPFAGSGSTGKGAVLEGFRFKGFEMDEYYTALANARIQAVTTA